MGPHRLEKLFSPASIAVFGASERSGSVGAQLFSNLLRAGYRGELYPVNPNRDEVQGRRCYPSISAIEAPVELAVIATPAPGVAGILRECGEHGVSTAVVLSAGFREVGDKGALFEQQLLDTAKHYNIRMLGPNCLGFMRPGIGVDATFLDMPAAAGRLALVSQSGALCTAILDWAKPHQLGFSTVVSLGNAADVDFGDVLDYLAVDRQTDAILLYMEGIQDARAFMSGLRSAARAKPVIVLKVGRHQRGVQAASTHTGALIGSDDVFDAALERAGVVRAMTFGQLFAAAEILSTNKRVNGDRLAIVTNGGGPGVLATDRAEDLRIQVPDLGDRIMQALDKELPPHWSKSNPVDLLGDSPPELYGKAVTACLEDPSIDGVLTLLTPQAMSEPTAAAEQVIEAARKHRDKPVLACWMGWNQVQEARQRFADNQVPHFITPERAVEAFAYLARHHLNQRLLLQTPGPLSDARTPDVEGARMIIDAALEEGRSQLTDTESKAILSAFRITSNPTLQAHTATEAVVAAESVGLPVVMKITSPQISHKSDIGGVRTNIQTAVEVRAAFREMMDRVKELRPEAELWGVTVETMCNSSSAREMMVGVKSDPVFGPVIAFGAGGTMAEVLRDRAVALPPLNAVLAERLINRLRVSRLLKAYRNLPAVNERAVLATLMRVSEMVCELPQIREMDINPLFVDTERAVAVDARITVSRSMQPIGHYEHMAIHPYPSHLVQKLHLADGTPIEVRPIRPEDADAEQQFVRSLSPEARYLRFMQNIDELTPEMLVRFTQIDYSREMAMIARTADRQLGVARYMVNPDGETCEFAISVLDDWARKGIGTMLMEALMDAARQRGIRVMEGEVLKENARMLSLMKSLGFSVRLSDDDPGLRIVERHL
jgi:acetyltransferase